MQLSGCDENLVSGRARGTEPKPVDSNLVRGLLLGLLLVAATAVVYLPATHGGFIWDDDVYVSGDPLLTAPDGLKRIWFSLDSPSQYFPLVYTTFRIERSIWGLNPAGYHWVNIVFHAANSVLVWCLLRRLKLRGAFLAASIFALHPVHVESVAWITERKNVLCLFFSAWTALSWIEFLDNEGRRRWLFYALTLGLCALALFSKSTACTLPAALLLILWLRREPIDWRRLTQITPFLAMGFGVGLLAMWWERYHQHVIGKMFSLTVPERILVASRGVWFYLCKLIWPTSLTFSYPRWTPNTSDPLCYVWLVALVAVGAVVFYSRKRFGRGLEVVCLFYVLTLAPMLGFIMLYTFRYTYFADHYQYVASIGPIALFAAILTKMTDGLAKTRAFFRVAFGFALLAVLGSLTWHQCYAYADREALWRDTLKKNPQSWLAFLNLGTEFDRQGRLNDAIVLFRKASELNSQQAEVQNDLGYALLRAGNIDEALPHLRRAIELKSDYANAHNNLGLAYRRIGNLPGAITELNKALEYEPVNASAHNNLGIILRQTGKPGEAVAHYEAALKIQPDFAEVYNNLGNLLMGKGRIDEAILHFSKAVELQPGYVDARYHLAMALCRRGKLEEGIAEFNKAIELQPRDVNIQIGLATALFQRGRLEEAISHLQRALQLKPDSAEAHCTLGAALGSQGRLDEAILHFQEALKLRPNYVDAKDNLRLALARREAQQKAGGSE